MNVFKLLVCILAAIPLTTGTIEFYQGVASQQALGADLGDGFSDPALNNIFRFFAAIWVGFGVFLIIFVRNLERYSVPMTAALAIVVIGGVGRIMSVVEFGLPEKQDTSIWVVICVEVVIVPAMLVWFVRADKTGH
ncbi:DUF4345 domain-containing protein [Oricola sp.]|uniref:DUF4345 domain-containing protein n=1 Tax=Oricola sp. TaxID=1979950 RepID=UPI003BAC7A86